MGDLEVTVLNRQRSARVDARALGAFLGRTAAARLARAAPASLAVCLVSDRAMRAYNRRFRGVDRTTDVLSFPDGATDPEGGTHLGDVLISVPRAAAQAREAGHSLARELRRLLLHGYLHLLGYDHETDDGTMRRLERRLWRAAGERG